VLQRTKLSSAALSSLRLNLCDTQELALGDLPLQAVPFTVCYDPFLPSDLVEEFQGVIGKDGGMVCSGSYVQLSANCQV
jgi:hypothetical protein